MCSVNLHSKQGVMGGCPVRAEACACRKHNIHLILERPTGRMLQDNVMMSSYTIISCRQSIREGVCIHCVCMCMELAGTIIMQQ